MKGPVLAVRLLLTFSVILRYCDTVKNITVSVPDDVYRLARIRAALQDTSVSSLVADFLRGLSDQNDEFGRLHALQRRVQSEITDFRGGDRLPRDEVHDRALP